MFPLHGTTRPTCVACQDGKRHSFGENVATGILCIYVTQSKTVHPINKHMAYISTDFLLFDLRSAA